MGSGSILVTGASSGIGAATVAALVKDGFHVWATVRKPADAELLAQTHGDRVTPLLCDITDDRQVAEVGERVSAAGPLQGLVNNAGTAIPAPLEYIPLDRFRDQLDINLTGQLAVTQAVLPALRQAKGRIVTIGSIAGRLAGPILGPYHAAKFALRGLTDTLRAELAPSGIKVILIEPGAIATPIWKTGPAAADELLAGLPEATRVYQAQIARSRADAVRSAKRGLPPAQVAALITRALTATNPRPRYLIGRDAQLAAVVALLPFRLRYRLTAATA